MQMALPDLPVHKAQRVLMVLPDLAVVRQVRQAIWARQAQMVLLARQAAMVQMVVQALPDPVAMTALQVHRELPEIMVQMAIQVLQGLQVHKGL